MEKHIRNWTPNCLKAGHFLALAGQLEHDGNFEAAEAIYKDSLQFFEGRGHDPESDANWTTNLINNYGMMLSKRGRVVQALPLLEKNLQLRRQLYSEAMLTMMHLSDAVGNFASVLEQMNRGLEAEPLYRESIELNQKGMGAEHASERSSIRCILGILLHRS